MPTAARWQTYQDFSIKIKRAGERTYMVEAQGPTGEAVTTFDLPFDEKDIEIFLLKVGRSRRSARHGRVPAPMQLMANFGSQLYNAVMSGNVRDIFMKARHDTERGNCGLRIRLRLSSVPELADLPWEFLFDGRDFLALSDDILVVRYLDLPNPPRSMTIELPLRILVTISAPRNLMPLDVEAEQSKIQEALATLKETGMLEVDFITDVTLGAFQRALRLAKSEQRPYHIWHYVGHGAFDPTGQGGVLMFCDQDGMSLSVGGFQIGTLFSSLPEMRLVLLNACEGARTDLTDPFAGAAVALVERGVSAVIGMQFEISDEAAIAFTDEFYTALVDGLPVDAAVVGARRAVFFMPNWVEWAAPVLHMRSPDGVLFSLKGKSNILAEPPVALSFPEMTGGAKSLFIEEVEWLREEAVPIWKDLEPPIELGDRVPHSVTDALSAPDGWHIIGSSRRGKMHAHKGIFREGAFAMGEAEGWHLMVVADGGGSCSLSRVGSHLAAETAVARMAEIVQWMSGKHLSPEEIAELALQQGLKVAWEALASEAEKREINLRELGTTFLALMHHPSEESHVVGVAQVGDGLVAAELANGKVIAMAEPDVGETAGMTLFLTSRHWEEWLDRVNVVTLDVPPRLLTAMCDGVADDFIPFEQYLGKLFHGLNQVINQEQPEQSLLLLLGYEKHGSIGDRTLTLIYKDPASTD